MVAVIERDDNAAMRPVQTVDADQIRKNGVTALADIFHAILFGITAVVDKSDVPDRLAIVAEKDAAPLALAFADFGVAWPAQRIDQVGEDLVTLGDALLRHQGIGSLRRWAGSKHEDRS